MKKKKTLLPGILSCILLSLLPILPILPLHAQEEDRPTATPRWALSGNLLSWATLAPNIGAEVYIGRKWSVAADASFGMWGFGHTTHTAQTWSAGGEARYWLQTARHGFHRTHIGVSLRGGKFDDTFFSNGSRGNALLAGLTVGYRFRLPGNHWRVDAGLGAGYIRLDYDKYLYNRRFGAYELKGNRTRGLLGLTDLHVSLVYCFTASAGVPFAKKRIER